MTDPAPPTPGFVIEPVESRAQLRRFAELPFVLHGAWAPPGIRAYEQFRLDDRRHPYLDRAEARFFLLRRGGRLVGRIAAHHGGRADAEGEPGRFGFFDSVDAGAATRALVQAAGAWLAEEGRDRMIGCRSWTAEEDLGLLVDGFEERALTALPWHPRHHVEHLVSAGGTVVRTRSMFRLDPAEVAPMTDGGPAPVWGRGESPPQAGRYADARLVAEEVAAVPDVSALLQSTTLRTAWRAARTARHARFDTAVVVRCSGDPSRLVPHLASRAASAGYANLWSPWAPDDRPADRTYGEVEFDLREFESDQTETVR